MNAPEDMRETERKAQRLSADIAALMLRHPSTRWILSPLRRLVKRAEREIDEWLKEEGWR
jgi:hypothetical protein